MTQLNNAPKNDTSLDGLAMSDAALDAIFDDARSVMPNFHSENFTKIVLNALPENIDRRKAPNISFELVGVLVGLIAAYFMIDFNSVVNGAVALMPQSITLSPTHLLFGLVGISAMSVAAWWVVERGR